MKIQCLVVKIADNTVWNVFDIYTSDGTIENTKFLLYDDTEQKFVWDSAANYTAYNSQQNQDNTVGLPVDLYTITFMLDGTLYSTQIITYPNKIVKPADPDVSAGHTFYGWYTDEECTEEYDFDTTGIDENTTLYSQILINTHTVSYDAGDGTGVLADESSPYDYGDMVTVLAGSTLTPPEGKLFSYWTYIESEVSHDYDAGDEFTLPDYDIVMIAQYVDYYTLSYDANTGTGTIEDAAQYLSGDAATVLPITGITPPADYLFLSWNTASDGSGIDYDADDVIYMTEDVTLYAKYAADVVVSYDANTGTGTMTDTESPYYPDDVITVLENTFIPPVDYLFSRFNTASDGSGTDYCTGDEITATVDITLYAIWSDVEYDILYDANGGTGTLTDASSPYVEYHLVTIEGIASITAPIGEQFVEWNTQANGLGTGYDPGDEFRASESLTLYAIWIDIFDVSYDSNNVAAETFDDTSNPYVDGSTVTVLENMFTVAENYEFVEWNTQADGLGTSYDPADEIAISEDVTLYAVWNKIEFDVTYAANDGTEDTVADDSNPYDDGATVTVGDNTFDVPSGKEFSHWSTAADGSGTDYEVGATFEISADVTLYAIWDDLIE